MPVCSTPYCENIVKYSSTSGDLIFCDQCKAEHSSVALRIQVDHGKTIKEVLFDAKLFKTAQGMADYIGITPVSLYNWIEKYFGISYQEFKRRYICRSNKCYLLDIRRSSYRRSDYILKKLRSIGRCACANMPQSNVIMTNATKEEIKRVFKGSPAVKLNDSGILMLAPLSIHVKTVLPIHVGRDVVPLHIKNEVSL